MKQRQPTLSRLSGLVKKRENKETFSPPTLTSLFLHQIVTTYNKTYNKLLLFHLLPHARPHHFHYFFGKNHSKR
jgi:hypothetical protein